jgi:hypothetical protein
MADIEQAVPDGAISRVVSLLVRVVVSFNLLLIALGFTENAEWGDLPEELFGPLRFGGFRFDFVWLCFSTTALFFAAFFFAALYGESKAARVNAGFCIAGLLAFCIYIFFALFSGVLYFG